MLWKWTRRTGKGLLGVLTGLMVGGALYQTISTHIDERRFPPLGTMVDLGNRRLHVHIQGKPTGGPTVILDAGLGCNSLEWSLVQPHVALFTQVCSIDRPGQGWSDPSPLPSHSLNTIHDIHAALHKANIPGPYLLVGHSYGGMDMRLFASKYPDLVAGMVLVDPSHEDQSKKIPTLEISMDLAMLFSQIGLNRLTITDYGPHQQAINMFPQHVQQRYLAQVRSTKYLRGVFDEMSLINQSEDQLRAAEGLLGDKPLIVLSAGKTTDSEGTGFTREQIEEMTIWHREFQKDIVNKSTNSKQVIVDSDHMITRHQPAAIVEAIQEVFDAIRSGQRIP